jgi:hypothetical protein
MLSKHRRGTTFLWEAAGAILEPAEDSSDGTDQGLAPPPFFAVLPSRQPDRPRSGGPGPASLNSGYGSTHRSIDSGVPFWKGTGVFLRAGRRPGCTETARAAVSRSCQRFSKTEETMSLGIAHGGYITRHAEDAGRFAARRAVAAVASLNRWRGMLRSAKRRRSSGIVLKSASTKISTVSSLA